MGDEHNFVFCATDWVGMAFEDIPNAAIPRRDVKPLAKALLAKFGSFADVIAAQGLQPQHIN